jgi:hypothetical protein
MCACTTLYLHDGASKLSSNLLSASRFADARHAQPGEPINENCLSAGRMERLLRMRQQKMLTRKLLDGVICSCVGPKHVQEVSSCQLEVGQQAWRELPIQPPTESLHEVTKYLRMDQ